MIDERNIQESTSLLTRIVDNVERLIYGKREVIELVTMALIARGHVLIEDVPGTGKTSLVSALSASVDCRFKRIQFTPDVMPSDITGFSIFNQKTHEFEFRPGGVMSNIVLADEINRASAKTQSALLEAMEERQVTVDSKTYALPEPFMVLATQNPIEQYGTYPLPEAQVDRFLIKVSIGYPEFSEEVRVLSRSSDAKENLQAVATANDVVRLCQRVLEVHSSNDVNTYITEIVTATRNHPEILLGSSTRGGLATLAMARAWALLHGRAYVLPDDVKEVVPYTLCHRIQLGHDAKVKGRTQQDIIAEILSSVAVPTQGQASGAASRSDKQETSRAQGGK